MGMKMAMMVSVICVSVLGVSEAASSSWPSRLVLGNLGTSFLARKLSTLVPDAPLILTYHNGPVLSQSGSLPVFLIWYGSFSGAQRSIVVDFFASLQPSNQTVAQTAASVMDWWNITSEYKDLEGRSVSSSVRVAGEMLDLTHSMGKSLKLVDIQTLVVTSLGAFPSDPNAIYFVLTSDDVQVEGFCSQACASHFSTLPAATSGQQLPYAWVGNAASQCPGQCAWPFANPSYGPNTLPLIPPSGDVGMEGMVVNIASMLTGTATNPFDNAFYQGDAAVPLEAATACSGKFGKGAYPGYPGQLLTESTTGASYNVEGITGRKFLLPAIWNPSTLSCSTPSSSGSVSI